MTTTPKMVIEKRGTSYQIVGDIPEPARSATKNWVATFPLTHEGYRNAQRLLVADAAIEACRHCEDYVELISRPCPEGPEIGDAGDLYVEAMTKARQVMNDYWKTAALPWPPPEPAQKTPG